MVAVKNGITFYRVWQSRADPARGSACRSRSCSRWCCLLVAWAVAAPTPVRRRPLARPLVAAVAAAALLLCGLLFPLGQQAFFGKTTYVRHADVAVVFGAQVHCTGRASITLADRVATGVALYSRASPTAS